MLTVLRIKNLALVTDLTVELQPGFNVITGETGAGKSILIGGLSLVLGERADRSLIREGSDSCSVEAVFDTSRFNAAVGPFLEANGLELCEDHQLVLKRTISTAGANRQFINGSPTTLAVLSELGQFLVDIHGPHEHQSLLYPARQLAILDAFGKLEADREAFGALLRRRAGLLEEKAALIVDERSYQQQLDLLRFQVNEIAAARLQPAEDEQVEQEYRRAGNSAKLLQLSQAALDLLAENENSILTHCGVLGRTIQELQRTDPSAVELSQVHGHALDTLHELQAALSQYADKVEVDPVRLQELEERLNALQGLKRKYGATLAEVVAFGQEGERKLRALEGRDAELARLNAALQQVEAELWRAGRALSGRRRKLIPQLAKAVVTQLSDLGFKQSRFDVAISSVEPAELNAEGRNGEAEGVGSASPRFSSNGLDAVEFQFAPNPGEPVRSLRAIASSGELARVMLALKTVLAVEDQVPVLVFDEVDANVGGETANAVAEKMRQIAKKRQVLCITHLPQVAAPAEAHFLAVKRVQAGRTVSEITRLEQSGRVTELARMLGGQTAAARKHAEALLK